MDDVKLTRFQDANSAAQEKFKDTLKTAPLERQIDLLRELLNQQSPPIPVEKSR